MRNLIFQPTPSSNGPDQDVLDVLERDEGTYPLESPIDDSDVILQICKWVLEMRIKGHSNATLAHTLTERLELTAEEASRLLVMAETAGALAADTTDTLSDPSDAVAQLEKDGMTHDLAVELVNMSIHLFHDIVDEVDKGSSLALGIDVKSAEAYFAAAEYVLDSLDAGRDRRLIETKLIEKEIFPEDSASGFIDEVLLAREAGKRIAAGEEGTHVFEELKIQDRSPYVMLLALRLKK